MPKAILESVDELSDELAAEYDEKEVDGKKVFVLKIDGVRNHPDVKALQTAHERQKQATKDAKDKLKELETKLAGLPEDFDADEWHRLQALDGIDPDDPEAAKKRKEKQDEALAQQRRTYEQQIAALKKQLEDLKTESERTIAEERTKRARDRGERELEAALSEAGIQGKFRKAVKALHAGAIKTADEEDGDPRVYVDTDLGEVSITEYIKSWAQSDEGKEFVEPIRGGGADGGHKGGIPKGDNPFTANAWNKTKQNQLSKTNRVAAEQAAKSAGFQNLDVALAATRAIQQKDS